MTEQNAKEADELEEHIVRVIHQDHPNATFSDAMNAMLRALVKVIVAMNDTSAERAEVMRRVRESLPDLTQYMEEYAAFCDSAAPTSDRVQ